MRELKAWKTEFLEREKDPVELFLALCTGIVVFGKDAQSPLLVMHAVPFYTYCQGSALEMAEFDDDQNIPKRRSINMFLDEYRQQYGNNTELGIYLASGKRANNTDLMITRGLLLDERCDIMGGELNRSTRMRIFPQEKRIDLIPPHGSQEPYTTFRIGERYPLNLRT